MLTTADYLSAIVMGVLLIAAFVNLRAGTLGAWLKAKFLGLS